MKLLIFKWIFEDYSSWSLDVLLILHFTFLLFCCYKKDIWLIYGMVVYCLFIFTILVLSLYGIGTLVRFEVFTIGRILFSLLIWAWFINVLGLYCCFLWWILFYHTQRKNTFNGIVLWSVKKCDYAINRILQHENQFLLMYQINNCICAYLLFMG